MRSRTDKETTMAVTALEIQSRSMVLDGRPFGAAGAYEKLAGVIRFAVDPAHPAHRDITDLELAPRNAAGLVESWADFYLLRPADASRGNRRLLLDVPNRGRKVALGMFNSTPRVPDPTTEADFGNGFLMRHGYTVAWCGWQPDVPRRDGLMALSAPLLSGVTGLVRCEFRPVTATDVLPLADRYHIPQPTIDVEDVTARLTVREHTGAAEVSVPRSTWRFARRDGGQLTPDASHIHLATGFQPGNIYELVYRSADPAVIGLGFLAVRDTAAFLKRAPVAAGNPCAGALDRAYVFGVSQSGRFLRHLLYLGLTEDEQGRDVFDAVIPHVAGARRGEFNLRFGQPSLNARNAVGELFPFTDAEQADPETGARDGLLARLRARGRVPKIFATNTSAEYWRGDASLGHTDVQGRADVEPPAEVRNYLFAGTQHTPGALPPPEADPNTGGRGHAPFNVVDYAPLLRAALVALDRWVSDGVEPPPSAVPRLADGTAVPPEVTARVFRRIPGVRLPDRVPTPVRLDFGPSLARGIVTELPPKAGAPYTTLVPAVDDDGNEIAGVRGVELAVPLGAFTGWNPRHPEQGAPGDLMSMMGSTLGFPRDPSERERTGDPRRSIAERYGSRAAYLARVREATDILVRARWTLAEDVDAIVERAGRQWDLFQQGL
jgi:alpha/beta hydrolase family protein